MQIILSFDSENAVLARTVYNVEKREEYGKLFLEEVSKSNNFVALSYENHVLRFIGNGLADHAWCWRDVEGDLLVISDSLKLETLNVEFFQGLVKDYDFIVNDDYSMYLMSNRYREYMVEKFTEKYNYPTSFLDIAFEEIEDGCTLKEFFLINSNDKFNLETFAF